MDMEKKIKHARAFVLKTVMDNYNFNVVSPTQKTGVKLEMFVGYEHHGISATGMLVNEIGEELTFDFSYKWDEVLPEEMTGTFTLTEVLDMLRSLHLFHQLVSGDMEIAEATGVDTEALSKMTDEFQSEFGIPTMSFRRREIRAENYTREGLNLGR